METCSAKPVSQFPPQVARVPHEHREVTCSKCGQSLAETHKLERPIPPMVTLRRTLSEIASVQRDQRNLRSVSHLFSDHKNALDAANATVKKDAYRVKDSLQQAMQNLISSL